MLKISLKNSRYSLFEMKTKILMVCLGNICRSPLAEGVLQSKLPQADFLIDSAGTGGWHAGETPDKRSVKVGQKYGVDISQQRARQFTKQDFNTFDVIYVMDANNYNDVLALAPNQEAKDKVRLIMNELSGFENTAVPDPYWGTAADFEHVYQLLDKVCSEIAKKLLQLS